MAEQAKDDGKKQGSGREDRHEHQGVHPGSTTQNKAQRQQQAEKRPDQKTRVINEE